MAMDFALSELHREVLASAERFASAELAPKAEELEHAPDEALESRLDELGLWGICLPENLGGVEFDLLAAVIVVETFAAVSPSFAWRYAMHAGPASAVVAASGISGNFGEAGARLGFQGPGCWGTLAKTMVCRENGGAVIREGGTEQETPAIGLGGAKLGESTGGSDIGHSSETGEFAYELMAGAMLSGMAQGAQKAAVGYALEREQFGRPIAKFQAIQWKLADGATAAETASLMVRRAASLSTLEWSPSSLDAARRARLFAGKAAVDACSEALQVHGGYGYTKEYPVERLLRGARMLANSDASRVAVAAGILSA